MARPIEPTPILRGKDADRFYRGFENAKYSPTKEAQLERARDAYNSARKHWNTATAKYPYLAADRREHLKGALEL